MTAVCTALYFICSVHAQAANSPHHPSIEFRAVPRGLKLRFTAMRYEFFGTDEVVDFGRCFTTRSSPEMFADMTESVLKHEGCRARLLTSTRFRIDGLVKDGKLYPLKAAVFECPKLTPDQMPKVYIPKRTL